jgi:exosortase/archaeosortase family protein
MTLLSSLFYFPHAEDGAVGRAIRALLQLQARLAGALIGYFDRSVHVHATVIDGAFSLQIVKTCSALDVQLLYLAAVLSYPAPWRRRLLGSLLGWAGLFALNLLRIAGLYWVGVVHPAAFESVHEELLPLLLIVAACAAFALWLRWGRDDALTHA